MGDPRTKQGDDGLYTKPDNDGRVRWYGRAWVPSLRKRRYWALGTNEARARKFWHAVLADVEAAWAKREAEKRQRKESSIEKLVAAFLDPHRKGRAFYATTLKAPVAALGSLSPAKLDAETLDNYLDERRMLATKGIRRIVNDKPVMVGAGRRKVSEATLRKEVVALGTVFRWAKRRGLVATNPLAEYDKPKGPGEHGIVVLSPDQEDALLAFLPALERDVIEWALYSGMRRGEVLALSWSGIDRARGAVHVVGTKTGKARVVPLSLSERLPAILDRNPQLVGPRGVCPLVFHDQDGRALDVDYLNGKLEAAMKAAKVEKPRGALWNLLRKTWVSRLYASGKALPQDEADIAGHSMAVAVRHYRALSAEHHERLAGALDGAPGGARSGARNGA